MLPLSHAFSQHQLLNPSITHEPAVLKQRLCSIIEALGKEKQSLNPLVSSPSAKELSDLNFSILEPLTDKDFMLIDSPVKESACQDLQDQLQTVQEEMSAELRLVEIRIADEAQLALLSKGFEDIDALQVIKKLIEEKRKLAHACKARALNLLFSIEIIANEIDSLKTPEKETQSKTHLEKLHQQKECLKHAIECSEQALSALDFQDKQIHAGCYGDFETQAKKVYAWQLESCHHMVKALERLSEFELATANCYKLVREFQVVQDNEKKNDLSIAIRAEFDPSQGSILGAYAFKSLWNQASRISNSLVGKEVFSQWHSAYSGKVFISCGQFELVLPFSLRDHHSPGAIAMSQQLALSQNLRHALDAHEITPQQVMKLLEHLSWLKVEGQNISMINRDSAAMLVLKQKCASMLAGIRTLNSIASA